MVLRIHVARIAIVCFLCTSTRCNLDRGENADEFDVDESPAAAASVETYLAKSWGFEAGDPPTAGVKPEACQDGGQLAPGVGVLRGPKGLLYRFLVGSRIDVCGLYEKNPKMPEACSKEPILATSSFLWVEARPGKDCFWDAYELSLHKITGARGERAEAFRMPGKEQIQLFLISNLSIRRLVSWPDDFLRWSVVRPLNYTEKGYVPPATVDPWDSSIAINDEGVFAMVWLEKRRECDNPNVTFGGGTLGLAFSSNGRDWVVHSRGKRIAGLRTDTQCGEPWQYVTQPEPVRHCTTYDHCLSQPLLSWLPDARLGLSLRQSYYSRETNRTGSVGSIAVSALTRLEP